MWSQLWEQVRHEPIGLFDVGLAILVFFLVIWLLAHAFNYIEPKISGLVNRYRKGSEMSAKKLRAMHVQKILSYGITSFIEDYVHKGILNRKEANRAYNRFARTGLSELFQRRRTPVYPNPIDLKIEIEDTLNNKVHQPIPVTLPDLVIQKLNGVNGKKRRVVNKETV